jgi:hypothetical protein
MTTESLGDETIDAADSVSAGSSSLRHRRRQEGIGRGAALGRVDVYTRQSTGGWLLQTYEDGDMVLPSLGATLSLDTIYRATTLASR